MKLVNFVVDGEERVGAWVDPKIYDLNLGYALALAEEVGAKKAREIAAVELPPSMMDFIRLGRGALGRARRALRFMAALSKGGSGKKGLSGAYDFKRVRLAAPVPRPSKLFCLAGNYSEHIREGGGRVAEKEKTTPRVFMKPPTTTITAPNRPVVIPKKGNRIDWEVELAVVMGRRGKYIPKEKAYDYVFGYTILNDISERKLMIDIDREPRPGDEWFDWLNGKWMDTFAPMGPCLVLKDEIKGPHNLRITLRLNGRTMQDANTGDMIFSIPELIEWISRLVTLEAGDVISTGTPSGVGSSSGTFLKKGDVLESQIEGIGMLRTPVTAE